MKNMCFQDHTKPQNKERQVEGVGSLREAFSLWSTETPSWQPHQSSAASPVSQMKSCNSQKLIIYLEKLIHILIVFVPPANVQYTSLFI